MTQNLTAAYIGALGVVKVGATAADDFTAAAIEPIIQQAIDVVSLESGFDIAHLSGSAGSMTASLSDSEIACVSVMTHILAVNACLNRDQLPWSIERRDNMMQEIGSGGQLTRRYDALVTKLKAKQAPALIAYNDPIPDEE